VKFSRMVAPEVGLLSLFYPKIVAAKAIDPRKD